jgi:hypothetical protein
VIGEMGDWVVFVIFAELFELVFFCPDVSRISTGKREEMEGGCVVIVELCNQKKKKKKKKKKKTAFVPKFYFLQGL